MPEPFAASDSAADPVRSTVLALLVATGAADEQQAAAVERSLDRVRGMLCPNPLTLGQEPGGPMETAADDGVAAQVLQAQMNLLGTNGY